MALGQNERASAFDQELADKLATQEWVRTSIAPRLNAKSAGSEESLLALHYASTWNIRNKQPLSPQERNQEIVAELGLTQGKTGKEARRILSQLNRNEHPTLTVHMPSTKERGRYRLLAKVDEKRGKATHSTTLWRKRAIQVFQTRAGITQESFYIAPKKEVDLLMKQLCDKYDGLAQTDTDPVTLALKASFFYSVGNKLIHPFTDANHRAFDRFIEKEFARIGITLRLPKDHSGNIPPTDRFKVVAGNVTTNFLRLNGLDLFRHQPSLQLEQPYQTRLVGAMKGLITQNLGDPLFLYLYSLMAAELLKHTSLTGWERRIDQYKIQAEQSGVVIAHRAR